MAFFIDYWKEEAEQIADHFSEQTLSCTLKGNLEKKIALKKLEENVQQDKAIAKELSSPTIRKESFPIVCNEQKYQRRVF